MPSSSRDGQDFADRLNAIVTDQRVTGFEVLASDGAVGKVANATADGGIGQIVIDTKPWKVGSKVAVPIGVIGRIDWDNERVYVNRTKDQLEDWSL